MLQKVPLTNIYLASHKSSTILTKAVTEKGKKHRPPGRSTEAVVKARNILLDNQINLLKLLQI